MPYPSNIDATLHIGKATTDPLPEGSADSYEEVPWTGSIQPPTFTINVAYFNVTNNNARHSIGGKLADQSVTGNVVLDWDAEVVKAMFADINSGGGVKRNWYLKYPTGDRFLSFRGFLSAWEEEAFDAGDEAKEHRANFTISVDGAVTVADVAPGSDGWTP
jgi:hypothetical protein